MDDYIVSVTFKCLWVSAVYMVISTRLVVCISNVSFHQICPDKIYSQNFDNAVIRINLTDNFPLRLNVLKNLDSHHLEDDDIKLFFPANGYNLDPYFKDFPVFGYFQYAPEFDTSHELDIAHGFDTTQKFDAAPEFDKAPEIDVGHEIDTALHFDTAPRRRRMTPHREGRVLTASSPLIQGIRDLPLSSETGPHMPSLPKVRSSPHIAFFS